jgi:hypothetical protein
MAKAGTVTAQATAAEPPRIKKFHRELVKVIPHVPNKPPYGRHATMPGFHSLNRAILRPDSTRS